MTESKRSQSAERGGTARSFFSRLPWEKTTIWGLFLVLVYVLRSFFALIFLTFIFSYIMVNLVRAAHRVISPRQEKIWLHRSLTVVSFALLVGSLYGVFIFLEAPFRVQIEAVASRVQKIDLKNLGGKILSNTIGAWQYDRLYDGKEGKERLRVDLEEFKKQPRVLIREFDRKWRELEQGFREWFRRRHGRQRRDELEESGELDSYLKRWVEEKKAAAIYANNKDVWDEKWEKNYVEVHGRTRVDSLSQDPPLEELQKDPAELEKRRTEWVLAAITRQTLRESETYLFAPDFQDFLADEYYAQLEASHELRDELEIYYTGPEYYREDPSIPKAEKFSYTFEKLMRLRENRDSPETFRNIFLDEPDEHDERIEKIFERYTKEKLAREAVAGWDFISLESLNQEVTNKYIPQITKGVASGGVFLFKFAIEFLLSLLLSFFITMDIHRLKKGLELLKRSRAQNFYNEISPSLAAFGGLIGRAFQAQGVIALCNTLLTFALIKVLHIPNETFLCAIVFICSFIPVLGVVLSTVPIALVALIYVDASAMVLSVLGVLVVHFIETSILNPKILGEMMHLHPVLVLCILAVGERFFHVWGLLLGVPVAVYIIRYVILGEDIARLTEAPALRPVRASAGLAREEEVVTMREIPPAAAAEDAGEGSGEGSGADGDDEDALLRSFENDSVAAGPDRGRRRPARTSERASESSPEESPQKSPEKSAR